MVGIVRVLEIFGLASVHFPYFVLDYKEFGDGLKNRLGQSFPMVSVLLSSLVDLVVIPDYQHVLFDSIRFR